jgi:hypothetical protein
MFRKYFNAVAVAGILLPLAAPAAISDGTTVPFPDGFRNWFAVNSMIVTKDSPISAQIGGMHIIYVNAKGLPILKRAGPFPYPDGTVFADDVHDFSVKDGSYVEGPKKAVTVMVKDATKYATTGGWGFQVWAGGDPTKPLVPEGGAIAACFACHTPQAAQDYVFSTYIP